MKKTLDYERDRLCLACSHAWTEPVVLSDAAVGISGELRCYCPRCNSKQVMSMPARRVWCGASLALFLLLMLGNGAARADKLEPYSCGQYREAARKCAYNTIGKCYVEAEMERLKKQCLREGGNP